MPRNRPRLSYTTANTRKKDNFCLVSATRGLDPAQVRILGANTVDKSDKVKVITNNPFYSDHMAAEMLNSASHRNSPEPQSLPKPSRWGTMERKPVTPEEQSPAENLYQLRLLGIEASQLGGAGQK